MLCLGNLCLTKNCILVGTANLNSKTLATSRTSLKHPRQCHTWTPGLSRPLTRHCESVHNTTTKPLKHIFQSWQHRALFMIALIVGGCFETLGYVGRAISSHNKTALGPYIIQSTFILLGPALFAASIYMTLGRIIRLVNGEKYALIRATWLTKIFVAGDVLSFLTQGSGAGLMSQGSNSDPEKAKSAISTGRWIIIGGLLIQLVL